MSGLPPLLVLDTTWGAVEGHLTLVAESNDALIAENDVDRLRRLGLAEPSDPRRLSPLGERYYRAKFVHEDEAATQAALAEILRRHPLVTAFCSALWGSGLRPVSGALRLIRQLTKSPDDVANRRWLALMNAAGLIVYSQKMGILRVVFNPDELSDEEEPATLDETLSHIVGGDTPYSNRLALRKVIMAAKGWLWWYEQHLPGKVLEVLVGHLDGAVLRRVRLLSGPAGITADVKKDFGLFAKEIKKTRGIDVEWRVLTKEDARTRHDRIILSDGFAMNVPPVNTILMGGASEFLPSRMKPAVFSAWWDLGTDLADFPIESPART